MHDPPTFHDDPPGLLGLLTVIALIAASWVLVLVTATALLHLSGPAALAALAAGITTKALAAVTVLGCCLLLINHHR